MEKFHYIAAGSVFSSFLSILPIFLLIVVVLIILYAAFKTKKPLKTLFFSALLGLIALFAISFTGKFTGVYLPINGYTLVISSLGGICGVIMLTLIKFIWGI